MRHRRRINTQTIQRKAYSPSKTRFSPSKKKRSKLPIISLALITVIVLIFVYKNELIELFPAGNETSVIEENTGTKEASQESSIPIKEVPAETVQYFSPIEKKIQLEILNGCGEKGVAKKLAALLKKSKYDIVNSGNYIENGKINWQVQETKIIDQVNNQENARDLADQMGILYANVEIFDNPSPISDITIIIGKDYKLLSIFQ